MTVDHYARDRTFWRLMGHAAVVGLIAGVAALAFTQLVRLGTEFVWGTDVQLTFLAGEWWWLAILGGAGVLVGILRMVWRVPEELGGSLTAIQDATVDTSSALPAIAVSAVSLIGGASLGPFDAGIRSGGAVGEWFSRWRRLPEEMREVNTLSGINGALGSLLTAPILATLMVTELRWPDRSHYFRVMIPNLAAAIFGFAITFAIVGDTFLGVFALPSYDVRFWHFGLAVLLGIVAAALSWVLGMSVFVLRHWGVPLLRNPIARSTIGGLTLGLIGIAFPLTLASGKTQMAVAIEEAETIGAALLIGIVFAKIVAVAISLTTGFIGGPVMPTLFIGGVSGLAVHVMFPEIPIALAFSAMLVAVPGVSIGAPFTMIFLAALTVGIGAVETVPAGVAVLTAYTVTSGLGWFGFPTDHTTVDIDEVSVQSELFDLGEAEPIDEE